MHWEQKFCLFLVASIKVKRVGLSLSIFISQRQQVVLRFKFPTHPPLSFLPLFFPRPSVVWQVRWPGKNNKVFISVQSPTLKLLLLFVLANSGRLHLLPNFLAISYFGLFRKISQICAKIPFVAFLLVFGTARTKPQMRVYVDLGLYEVKWSIVNLEGFCPSVSFLSKEPLNGDQMKFYRG